MGRVSKIIKEKLASYDETNNTSKCLLCEKILQGDLLGNIKRHYIRVHKYDFDDQTKPYLTTIMRRRRPTRAAPSLKLSKLEFIKCCVGMVAVKDIPFRIFDDDRYFKRLIEPYENAYNLCLNSESMQKQISLCASKMKKQVAHKLSKKMICLHINVASRHQRNILCLNVQYIENFEIQQYAIGMIKLEMGHTAAILKDEIVKCLEEYHIELTQIYFTTIDNIAGVNKASQRNPEDDTEEVENLTDAEPESDEQYDSFEDINSCFQLVLPAVRSAAHSLQLSAYESFQAVTKKLDECRLAVNEIGKRFQKQHNIPVAPTENATRWSSTYDMVNYIYNLKGSILIDFKLEVDWDFVDKLMEAFQPLANCAKQLQAEQYVMGDFFRDWLLCEAELEDLNGNEYAQILLEKMGECKTTLMYNEAFLAALYFDPRFNYVNSPFFDLDKKRCAITHILETNSLLNNVEEQTVISNDDTSSDVKPNTSIIFSSSPYNKLETKLNLEIAKASALSNKANDNMRIKIETLANAQRVPFETNVLEYWRNLQLDDKQLKKLAQVILAIPSSQASVDKSSSALTTAQKKHSSKLDDGARRNLYLIKLNNKLLDEIVS